MAYETPSPLGIPWGYVVLLLLPVLVVVTVIYGVRTRRELLGRAGLVVAAAAAAGAWALVHTGSTTTWDMGGHPSECVWDPWGQGHGSNAADAPCDRALTRQLIASSTPAVAMIVVTVVGSSGRRRRPESATA
jgi:hypothetical protein